MAVKLTPVEDRNGRYYKREDAHRAGGGTNGAKLRACQHLIGKAVSEGATRIVTAASVLSPQHAIVANVSRQLGVPSLHIVGGTKPTTAQRHPSVQSALRAGAKFEFVPVGYNPYLQKAARERTASLEKAYLLHYGITPPPGATPRELAAFHDTGAQQVRNLPPGVRTLVIPFGSGNSAAGVLYGISQFRPAGLRQVKLIGIGPNRLEWLFDRLATIGAKIDYDIEHFDLHGTGYAKYGDKMPGEADGIVLHPTYEGKVVRYLDELAPSWWTRRNGTTCMWIVGGPLPTVKKERTR